MHYENQRSACVKQIIDDEEEDDNPVALMLRFADLPQSTPGSLEVPC